MPQISSTYFKYLFTIEIRQMGTEKKKNVKKELLIWEKAKKKNPDSYCWGNKSNFPLTLGGTVQRGVRFHLPRWASLPPSGEKYVIGHHSRGWIGCLRDVNENIWLCHFLTNRRLVTTSTRSPWRKMCNILRRELPITWPCTNFETGLFGCVFCGIILKFKSRCLWCFT